jgi:hypothetical protein
MIILQKVLGCLLIAGVILLVSGTIKIVIERLSTEPFLTQLPGLAVSLVIAIACARWAKKLITGASASANHKSSTPYRNLSGRVERISSTAATLRLGNGTLTEFRDNKLKQLLTEGDELSVLTGRNGQLLRVFRSKTMEIFQKDTSSLGYKIFFALAFIAFTSIPLLGSLLIMSAVSWCLLLSSKDALSKEPYARHRFYLLGLGGLFMLFVSCVIGASFGTPGGEDLQLCWAGTVVFSWGWIALYFFLQELAERAIDEMVLPKPRPTAFTRLRI